MNTNLIKSYGWQPSISLEKGIEDTTGGINLRDIEGIKDIMLLKKIIE